MAGAVAAGDAATVSYDRGQVDTLSTETDGGVEVAVVDTTVEDYDVLARAARDAGLEVVLVDTTVEDYDVLARAARDAGLEVVLVASAAEMEAALGERSNLAAVHVLSHGTVGQVDIGGDSLTVDSLARYSDLTAALDDSLVPGGDILLYGCRVATDGAGQTFVDAVSSATEGDVAASDDLTGPASLGGDWDLETTTGTIGSSTLSSATLESFSNTLLSTFDFEGSGGGNPVSQTVSGMTVTMTAPPGTSGFYYGGSPSSFSGSSLAGTASTTTSATLTFDQAVDISSIALGDASASVTAGWTLTPDGQNSPVSVTVDGATGRILSNLPWTGVTTVDISTTQSILIGVDDIEVTPGNSVPSLNTNAGLTVLEGSDGTQLSNTELDASDIEQSASSLTYQVTSPVSHGNLFVDGNGGGTVDGTYDGEAIVGTGSFTQADIDSGRLLYRHVGSETTSDSFDFDLSDGAGGTVAGNTFSISLTAVNDEPTLTATGDDPTFTEGGAGVSLYSSTSASTIESGQTFSGFTMTVTNLDGGTQEQLLIDGSTLYLTHGTSYSTTPVNDLSVDVTVVGSTATVSVTSGTLSATELQTLVDDLLYRHEGNDPTTANRVVTITSLQDSGGTANGGDDTVSLAVTSTISINPVNDEPTLTATGSDPTFTEGGTRVSLYSSASANAIESSQTFSGLTMTVTNVAEPSKERLLLDGSYITLSDGESVTTAYNGLDATVSIIGSTATVSVTSGTLTASELQMFVDGASYHHSLDTPSPGSTREVTITSVTDSGGTANGGDDTAALSIGSTVSLVGVNDDPTLTATGDDPTFTEGGSAVGLYSGSAASTVESGQTLEGFTVTVTNVDAPSSEVLTVDGSDVALTNANTLTTAGNSLDVSVSVVGTTATVSATSGTLSASALQTVLDGVTYRHTGDDPTTNRVVTITSLTDSGGTANGGDDTAALAVASTVSMVGVNDEPTLTATGDDPTFTEGGSAADLYSSASADAIESGQTFEAFTMTVTNVGNPGKEQLLVDGSAVTLTHANTLTTAGNGLSVSVSVIGTTATISATGGTLSTAAVETLLNNVAYQHTGDTPTTGNRDVTITSLTDSGGTVNGGDDTGALAIASTVSVQAANDEPTLTATGSNPTYIEGGSAASLYSSATASTVESGQQFTGVTMTVSNVDAPGNEVLTIDGSDVSLSNGDGALTSGHNLAVGVSTAGSTATVSISAPGGLSASTLQTIVDDVQYRHTGDDLDEGNDRVATITSLTDDGGTANGGDDTAALAVASTISLVDVNDEPTLTATGTDPTFTEGGTWASLYSSASADAIESGQSFEAFTMTVTNVYEPSKEQVQIDGSAVPLSHGTTRTTPDNSLGVSVSVIGSTATISITGGTLSTAALQTLLESVAYRHTGDTPSTTDRVATITSLRDSGGLANGGDDAAALAIASTVSVTATNDAPVLSTDTRSLSTLYEDETNNGGDGVGAILNSAGTESDVENDQIGIVVTDLDTSIGTWEYSLDSGVTWTSVETVSDSAALVLSRFEMIRFVPDPNDSGTASATIRAWDGTTGTSGGTVDASTTGGTTAYSAASATMSITVEDAPEVTAIGRSPGQANPTTDGTVDFEVMFYGSVTGLDASDFDIVTTGSAAAENGDADISVVGSGTAHTVSVANVAGDGTMTVFLIDDDSITSDGVPLGGVGTFGSGDGSYTNGETVTIDNTAPAAPPTPDLDAGSDTGVSASDDVTADTTPTFSGTAEADTTIEVFADKDGTLGTTTVNGNGDWSFTPAAAVSEATHSITVTATDAVGNTGPASSALSVTVDTTAPSAPSPPDLAAESDTGSSGTDDLTGDTTPTLTGAAEANATVEITSDLDGSLGTTTATESGDWAFTPNAGLTAGTHSLTAQATDAAGNTGPSSTALAVTIDTSIPNVTDFTATNPTDRDIAVSIITADPLSSISVSVAGPESTTLTESNFTENASGKSYTYTATTTPGTDGAYTVTLDTATNAAGNGASTGQSATVTVDTKPPVISGFTATNPSDDILRVALTADEPLGTVRVSFEGESSGVLSSFNRVSTDNGTYTYANTYATSGNGTYTTTLLEAADRSGNDGSNGETDSATVGTTTPDPDTPQVTAFDATVTSDGGLNVSIESTTALSTLNVTVIGPANRPLDRSAFTSQTTAEGVTYTATVALDQRGVYVVTLANASLDGTDATIDLADPVREVDTSLDDPPADGRAIVAVAPESTSVPTGDSAAVGVVANTSDGVERYLLTVGVVPDSGDARVTGVTAPAGVTIETAVTSEDNRTVTVQATVDEAATASQRLLGVELVGTTIGDATISLDVATLTAADGTAYGNITADNGSLRVETSVAPVDGDRSPSNTDADPLLEDIDGDGERRIADVILYFNERDGDSVRSNVANFDFDGDGQAGNIGDVIALFNTLFG